jgi:hypothetical protein
MLFTTRLMETSMTLNTQPLDEYFHQINKEEKQGMAIFDGWTEDEYQEPMTKVYFTITTPAVEHYPEHTHTLDIAWTEGARWHDVVWEILKVLEASYGYDIKDRVFFQMHKWNIEAEETHGDPELAKQMFTKELS